jgi:hypothetical protein
MTDSVKIIKKDGELFKVVCEEHICKLVKIESPEILTVPNSTPCTSPSLINEKEFNNSDLLKYFNNEK